MATVSARLVAGAVDVQLHAEPRVVQAGPVVLAVSGSPSRTVSLDGRQIRLSAGPIGLYAIDLTRSTGYHRLEVAGSVFWFGTNDAKLRLDGIEAMLAHLGTMGTGWTGQVLFSRGEGLRDSHVVYGWLDEWADRALAAANAVLRSPRTSVVRTTALSRRADGKVLTVPTLRLIRSDPRRHLSANPNGVLAVNGRRYDPSRVVVRRRRSTIDTIANRRAVALLGWLARLCAEVLDNHPDKATTVRCRNWARHANSLRSLPVAQSLATRSLESHQPRQPEEITEQRYQTTYEVARDLNRLFGWSADSAPRPRFSYVERADRIYQAYAASCLAQALGLRQTSSVLGAEQPAEPAFRGSVFDLYYDTTPPREVLRSWRAASSRPDESRPDLLLQDRRDGRVALLDAKYRLAADGGATESSRTEVTAYLGLYGLDHITILYPGSAAGVAAVQGHGRSILEVAVAPPADLSTALPAILGTLQAAPF